MIILLLLSNQLLPQKVIDKHIKLAKLNADIVDVIIVYEPDSFYKINDRAVSAAKKKYFKQCLTEYLHLNKKFKHIINLAELQKLKKDDLTILHFDFMDVEVEKELAMFVKNTTCKVIQLDSPMFLLSSDDRTRYGTNKKSFTFATFYKYHRVKLDIFPKPIGGKWSYDESNRNKIPQSMHVDRVDMNNFSFPTNTKDSIAHLKLFAKIKLAMFGPYQDAMHKDNLILWHAGISPMLNLGMINPRDVLSIIPSSQFWTEKNRTSYEGFLRQLFWREYMALVYRKKIPIDNIFSSNKNLPESWYRVKGAPKEVTGISYLDAKIIQSVELGYLHHIERLMLVGNFMLLAQIKPVAVYDWFMVNFLDAHHWVMVGNVYHMLLWASGLKITKRPYIASSAYLDRMITGGLTKEEIAIWDNIYARFIEKNKDILKHVYMMSGHLKKAKTVRGSGCDCASRILASTPYKPRLTLS